MEDVQKPVPQHAANVQYVAPPPYMPQSTRGMPPGPNVHVVSVPFAVQPYTVPFSTDLFDCFKDMPSCLDAWCCPWCTIGAQHQALHHPGEHAAGNTINPAVCLGTMAMDLCITGGCAAVLMSTVLRGQVRQRYAIRGDAASDFCASLWCTPCTLSQMTREMTNHGEWPGGVVFASKPPPATVEVPVPPPVHAPAPMYGVVNHTAQYPKHQPQQSVMIVQSQPPPTTTTATPSYGPGQRSDVAAGEVVVESNSNSDTRPVAAAGQSENWGNVFN